MPVSDSTRQFFNWIKQCCEVAGWPFETGQHMHPDAFWQERYQQGMSPEQAVAEYAHDQASV